MLHSLPLLVSPLLVHQPLFLLHVPYIGFVSSRLKIVNCRALRGTSIGTSSNKVSPMETDSGGRHEIKADKVRLFERGPTREQEEERERERKRELEGEGKRAQRELEERKRSEMEDGDRKEGGVWVWRVGKIVAGTFVRSQSVVGLEHVPFSSPVIASLSLSSLLLSLSNLCVDISIKQGV